MASQPLENWEKAGWSPTQKERKPMHDMALRVSLTMYQRNHGMGGMLSGIQLRHRRLHWVFYYYIMRRKFSFVHLRCVRGSRTQQAGRAIEVKNKGGRKRRP